MRKMVNHLYVGSLPTGHVRQRHPYSVCGYSHPFASFHSQGIELIATGQHCIASGNTAFPFLSVRCYCVSIDAITLRKSDNRADILKKNQTPFCMDMDKVYCIELIFQFSAILGFLVPSKP